MKDHAAILLKHGGKVLFVQRAATKKFLPNIWAFPSGTMEEEERAEETAVREAKEELGIAVTAEPAFATAELPELGARLHLVVCTSASNDALTANLAEIQNIRWMTLKEFFQEYTDDEIGHGLVYLRSHPEIWEKIAG